MSGASEPIRSAHRMAYTLGLGICLGTPCLIALLLWSGAVPPGREIPEGFYQQVGYLFTGLVFLSGTWVWGRRSRILRGFKDLPEAQRPAVILREGLLYAAVFEVSSLCGLAYWILVGGHAARHAWGFILLTPLLFLGLVPRYGQWEKASEG